MILNVIRIRQMKVLVIENEMTLDDELKKFIEYSEGNIFDEVEVQYAAQTMGMQFLAEQIQEADAILVQSTWMYKDQLYEYLKAFVSGQLGVKKFYVSDVSGTTWDYLVKDIADWERNEPQIYTLVQRLLELFEVYEVSFDYDLDKKSKDKQWNIRQITKN